MPGNYTHPKVKPPSGGVVWCPIEGCGWHQADSFATRERLGKHVVGKHYDDVVYAEGEVPEDLAEERKGNACADSSLLNYGVAQLQKKGNRING